MTVNTSAGTTLGLSAAAPATYNAAGYAALTYTNVGEVSDLGDIPSRIYELVNWAPIAERAARKAKGGYNLGSQTITVGIDKADAGQLLVDTATNSDAAYSVKIAHPQLGTIYARALVMGGPKNYGDVNTIATRQITLEYTSVDSTTDGVVFVP
ncbi:hypothetical protein FIM10_02150 [Sphingomonadales bacterium 56]|uniref:hypothetical protein n=1 Tax=Sphingobium sp. S6 TaxID=2758386 RepID=UPI00191A1B19|nr:hypothetical protein [Sphingobium sp. S6]MBY2927483.1 hypothetical protein [Sphingomonadales bacterium 56]CAD7335318.1 hypothetical protein SPHS6_00438 [Sphingobium sp. S6]